jgi:hypothetical protein
MTTTTYSAGTTVRDKSVNTVLPIRFVARTIRFIVMTVVVQCSDAWTKRHFKGKSARAKLNFRAANDPVDNHPVQMA